MTLSRHRGRHSLLPVSGPRRSTFYRGSGDGIFCGGVSLPVFSGTTLTETRQSSFISHLLGPDGNFCNNSSNTRCRSFVYVLFSFLRLYLTVSSVCRGPRGRRGYPARTMILDVRSGGRRESEDVRVLPVSLFFGVTLVYDPRSPSFLVSPYLSCLLPFRSSSRPLDTFASPPSLLPSHHRCPA